MNKKKRWIAVLCVAIVLLIGACVGRYKFLQHEKSHAASIESLQLQLKRYVSKVDALEFDSSIWTNDGYNYLAIGNSITKHGICEYWWNEIGMAASTEDKDYVHLLSNRLDYENVNVTAVNYSIWENQSSDRAETYSLLEPYLSPKIDLVTIQLGENAIDTTTFQMDYEELINYILESCHKAKVLVIGEFWADADKDDAKKLACKNCGVIFVDLSEIQGVLDYQGGMGTTVYDAFGNAHKIEHAGVAKHPGDKGMEWIADKILEELK